MSTYQPPETALTLTLPLPFLTYYCQACGTEESAPMDPRQPRPSFWAPALWRAGWTAEPSGYSVGHTWVCPACAATLTETRVLLALRGRGRSRRWLWRLPLRYRVEHALWVVRRWRRIPW